MNRAIILALLAILVLSCSQQAEKEVTTEENFEVVELSSFIDNTETYIDKKVALEGNVVHVCRHGGKKMFIVDSQDRRIKITCGQEIPAFDLELEGSLVKVNGIVEMDKITEEYCQEMETETLSQLEKTDKEHKSKDGESCEFDAEMEKAAEKLEHIEELRAEMKENGKGFIPVYSVKAVKFAKI